MTDRFFRQSEVTAFRSCPRSWWLSYQRTGYGHMKAPSLHPASGQRDVGTLFHSCVERYRNPPEGFTGALVWPTVLDEARLALTTDLGLASANDLPKDWKDVFELVRIMVEGYIEWLHKGGHDAGEQTIGTEVEVTLPIGNIRGDDVYLVCHIDHLVRDLTGEVIVSDYKTVQSLDQAKDILDVDKQGITYCMAASYHLGEPVRRFRHDMAKKVKRTARATPPFYERYSVRFSEEQIDNSWKHLVSTLDRMVEVLQRIEVDEERHHFAVPPSPSRDCTWKCDFLPVCPMMDSGVNWRKMLDDNDLYVRRTSKENE